MTEKTTNAPDAERRDGSALERVVRPRAWELRKDGEPYRLDWHAECRSPAYSWHPLYDQAALDAATTQAVSAERDLQRNVREVFARWIAEACGVLFEVEEEAEDGGESLRMLRERGLRLVSAVLHPKPGELPPWLEDEGPNVGIEPPYSVAAIDAAVAAERERCAKVAEGAQHLPNAGDEFANGWCSAALQIAQAIRA